MFSSIFLASLLLYFVTIASIDLLEYRGGLTILDQSKRTARCYDWFEHYLENNYDRDKDYSEGLFDDYNLTLHEATLKKFEYIYNKLELKPGMKLLDAGCGTGVWMKFCHDRGVDVLGLTLSPEQAKVVRQKGLKVQVRDYRKFNSDFINQFDRITALGSSEHVCSAVGVLTSDNQAKQRCLKTRIETWKLFYQYLKPQGKCYLTMLTVNSQHNWTARDWFQSYILERHYGGYYSDMNDVITDVIPNTGFQLTDLHDRTKDYHWSSLINKDHFGYWTIKWSENPGDKILYLFKGLLTDPYLIHHWIYYWADTWMWQFGGYLEKPLTDKQVAESPVLLKYFQLEKS